MRFTTPAPGISFEIPDDWWRFAEMEDFGPLVGEFYPPNVSICDTVPLSMIEPPQRNDGVALFKKEKLLPVLFAFQSSECALPPVQIIRLQNSGRYTFRVHNGFHRFYASAAIGFPKLPVTILDEDPLWSLGL